MLIKSNQFKKYEQLTRLIFLSLSLTLVYSLFNMFKECKCYKAAYLQDK